MPISSQEMKHRISHAIEYDHERGIGLRQRKLQAQMDKYGFDLFDVYHVLSNPERVELAIGAGERFEVSGSSIDGDYLTLIVANISGGGVRVVNAWVETNGKFEDVA